MEQQNAEAWEKVFPLKLVRAIEDPQNWAEALDVFMRMTGATGAIITLRDKTTCQIVNDVELEQKYHSPLIRGFSTEAVIHYLTDLRTIDPWAEFQRSYYPHRPLQMSKVCPQDRFEDQRFFDWLRDVGFEDTIVFELDRMAGYWTAINLFFECSNAAELDRAMEVANTHYDLLRHAWVTSQALAKSRQSSAALLERAAGANSPTVIVGPNGEMLDHNELFTDMLASQAIRVSGKNRKVSFAHSVTVVGLDRWAQHDLLRHAADVPPVTLMASPVDPDPIFAGKREKHWLLTCSASGITSSGQTSHAAANLDALTRQERLLYAAVAAGEKVSDAGKALGVQRSRSFEIWSSVKEKLGIKNAHQLRG